MVSFLVQGYTFIMFLGSWKALRRHYWVFWLVLPFIYWLQYDKLQRTPDCIGDWLFTSQTTLVAMQHAWITFHISSFIVGVVASMLRDSKKHGDNRRLIKLTFLFTILMWVTSLGLGLSVCEVAISTFVYRDVNGIIHYMTAAQWGLGQIMAIVLLALQLWDIGSYLREPSTKDATKSRLHYWWSRCGCCGTFVWSWS